MVIFITPLAAEKSVTNWPLTCSLLESTLASLQNQEAKDFRSFICCHDLPPFASNMDERFKFVEHPFQAPSKASSLTGKNNGVWDMMLKRDVALYHAQPSQNDFIMLLDADDLMHRSLVSDVNRLGDVQGVLLNHGYEFCYVTRRLLERHNMVDRSGSSFLLKGTLVRPPRSLLEKDLSKTIYHKVWHSNVHEYLTGNNLTYSTLDQCRTIYRTNTSLNHSDWYRRGKIIRTLKHRAKFFLGRKLTLQDSIDFGSF